MSKKKYSKEFKLKVLKEHEEGASFYSIEKKYDIVLGTVKRSNAAFKAHGEEALEHHNSNLCRYSAEFKQRVVSDYLSGDGSFETIAVKYGIHAESTVLKWVKLYNSHEELTDSRKVGDYLMAKDFRCSYGQVYSWVSKINKVWMALKTDADAINPRMN